MTGPERVPRSDVRFNPFAHVVVEPQNVQPGVRSSKKKDDAPQPPRPQNAWILYRAWALKKLLEQQPELKGMPQAQLSKVLGQRWANETPDIRKHFEHQANLSKERHARAYPDYVFRPQKKEEKERDREKKKQEKAREREAVKLRKEVEKNLRAGYLPPVMMSKPTVEVLQNLAFIKFADLGPSPPVSQCPSPDLTNTSLDDESRGAELQEACGSSIADTQHSEGSVPTNPTPTPSTSGTPSNDCSSDADQQSGSMSSVATPSQSDNAMSLDTEMTSDPSSDVPLDWSKIAMGGIELFLNKPFTPDPSGQEPNRFDMPSGNIVTGPGFVDGVPQNGIYDASELISIPLGESAGIFDDQYDCDLTNPHAEQPSSSSSSYEPLQQGSNEAPFMQPFVQLDVTLEHLLAAGREVGNALLDEQEACSNGERVIAAEHIQDGAPAMFGDGPGASSFLPSPPESSSSATSPLASGLFDFGSATNLCASGSNQDMFGSLGLSDSVSNTDISSPSWSLPSFNDYGARSGFGLGSSDKDHSNSAIQLPTSMGESMKGCEPSFPAGFFSDVPPTPVSAGPWKEDAFNIGGFVLGDFSSLNTTSSSTDEAQLRKEDAWLASYLNDPGSGTV